MLTTTLLVIAVFSVAFLLLSAGFFWGRGLERPGCSSVSKLFGGKCNNCDGGDVCEKKEA